MDEKKKEADSVSHFSAERIFGFWGQEKATEIPLTDGTCELRHTWRFQPSHMGRGPCSRDTLPVFQRLPYKRLIFTGPKS